MDNMNNFQQMVKTDFIPIVSEHNKEIKEQKRFEKQKEAKRVARVRNIKIGVINAAIATTLSIAVFSAAATACKQIVGGDHLANRLSNELSDEHLGHTDSYNDGYKFNKGTEFISYGEAVDIVKDQAKELGYNDAETYVAVSSLYSPTMAEDVVGKENVPDFSEKYEARQDAYYERQLGR